MENEILNALKSSFIFSSLDAENIEAIFAKSNFRIEEYQKGSAIAYIQKGINHIGIIISGEAKVYASGGKALMNILRAGNTFGVSSLFSDKKSVSEIIASKSTKVLFISENDFQKMLGHPIIRNALISFLTDRIRFLNGKISSFSQNSAEKKLASFILENEDQGSMKIPKSYKELSEALGMGRASLYRALDTLEASSAIVKSGKSIIIADREKILKIINGTGDELL